jgi:hypothetical protein
MAEDLDEQTPKRKSRRERHAEVHQRAMERFDAIWSVAKDERLQSLSDRRFATIRGAQWEGQYAFGSTDDDGNAVDTGLPRMEIPKVHKSLVRIFSEYRSNRVSVDFRPRGDDSDRASADNLDGLYRADENDTRGGGQDAYDNAFDEGIGGGMGGWRLRARYEDEGDEDNEHQRIGIEPIYDADQSLFFDLDAKHQDKSDARFGFLLSSMSRSAFEATYPDFDPDTFTSTKTWQYDWITPDTVTIAEYYEVDDGTVLRRTFRNIATEEERTEDDARLKDGEPGDTLEDLLLNTGWEEIRQRKIKRQRVRKYLLSGAEVLEDEGYIAGPNIPLVPYYAKRWYIDGVERCMGHTRLAIDASRIYNMMVSSLTEASAASPIARPVFDPEQVQGLEDSWARANIDRAPYSLARVLYGPEGTPIQIGPITVLNPPSVAPNVAALLQVAGGDIADLTGESDQAEQVPANTSAQAIELVHNRADVRTFIYFDNLRKAMQRSGEIWLGMAKELYVEEGREMVAIDAEGGQSKVKIAEPAIDSDGGQMMKNDLTQGRYEVIVDVGPASRTRKDATVKAMLGIAQTAATIGANDTAIACVGIAISNMDGEGMDGLRASERRKGIAAGYIEPTEQEAKEIEAAKANQQPQEDPNVTVANAQKAIAEAEVMKANIAAQDSNTKVIVAQAQSEKARADAAATLAGIDRADRDQVLKAVETSTKVDAHERDMTQPGSEQ